MKVLLVTNLEQSPFTGIGRWTYSIAQELRRTGFVVDEWYDSHVAVSAGWGRWSLLTVPFKIARLIWQARRDYDAVLVHEPTVWTSALLARIFPRQMPAIFAVSHGIESRGQSEFAVAAEHGVFDHGLFSRLKFAFGRGWQSNLGLRLAPTVICLNQVDARHLRERFGRTEENTILITNGIDPEIELPPLGDVLRDPNRVIVVSQWQDYKGRQVIPGLWATVRAACPKATLSLVGTGVEESLVRACFSEADQMSVSVLREVDRDELQRQLLCATVFLMPSIYEGSPLAMIEAMACGLGVVGSNAGGIPELLAGGCGRVFDWRTPETGAAAVIELLQNHSERQQLACRARKRAESLTWAATVAPIVGAIRSIPSRDMAHPARP